MPKPTFVSRAAALCVALHVPSAAMAQAQPAKPYADLHYEGPFDIPGCIGTRSFTSQTNDTTISLAPKGCFDKPLARIYVSRHLSSRGESTACYLDEGHGQVAKVEVDDARGQPVSNEPRPQATEPLQKLTNVIKAIPAVREDRADTLQSIRDLLPAIEKAYFDVQMTS